VSWVSSVNQQQQTPKRGPGSHHAITNAVSNGGLIRITATGHTFATSNVIDITGVLGTTEANKAGWVITVIDANTFDLQSSTFTNAYISGGQASLQ
jgi:hypothetical protein